jgi:hypothetical protein
MTLWHGTCPLFATWMAAFRDGDRPQRVKSGHQLPPLSNLYGVTRSPFRRIIAAAAWQS